MEEKKSKNGRMVLGAVLLGVFGLSGGLLAGYLNSAPQHRTQEVLFTIVPGTSVTRIAEDLEAQGIIRSSYVLRALAMVKNEERSYQVGSYQIPPGLSALEIQTYLTTGRQLLMKVTIPEGFTAKKIAKILETQEITGAEDFLKAMRSKVLLEKYQIPADTFEGLLYPDTYMFPKKFPAESVVDHMVANFMTKLKQEAGDFVNQYSSQDWYDRIILASIVEKEYRDPKEAPLISSVFTNRLENRIPLGSCASIEYIITEIKNRPHPKRIFFIDTEIDSPYNTYINKGLPPTPISNPGKTALTAAFNPAKTDYIYFVVKDSALGTHSFSKNYRDHNEARESYLAGFETKS